jgi:acyl dehydratase
MTTDASAHVQRKSLIGTRLEGRFTIDPSEHRTFTEAVFAPGWTGEVAHPMYLHLVAHCGKGIPLDEFFALMGTELAAGVTFGQGRLDYLKPLLIGSEYDVVTEFVEVTRKHGRTRPTFDLVTCRIEVRDGNGEVVGVSHESYVVPAEQEQNHG